MATTLTVKRRDTLSATFVCYDELGIRKIDLALPTDIAKASPVLLTGCTARLHIRDKRSLGLLYFADLDSGLTLDLINIGQVHLLVDGPVMETAGKGTRLLDLEITFPDGTVLSSATITLTVTQDITYTSSGEPVSLDTAITIPSAVALADGRMIAALNGKWVDVPAPAGGSGGGTWGTITGTLSAQTDLNTVLAGKAATLHTQEASTISDSTAAGRALLTGTDAAAQRTSLGLGTSATTAATAYATAAQGTKADTALQPAAIASGTITPKTGNLSLGELIASDTTGITGADAVTNIVSLTQAEYTAIGSPSASTLYIITDA